jgi:NADH dehydrogenase
MSTARPSVVVVGGGFGGLNVARGLARHGARVTLVDRRNYHLFQPLLYQVATSGLNPTDIAYPLRAAFHRTPGVAVRVGEVTTADLQRRVVCLGDGSELPYDHLVLAAGATTADFGVPGVAEHALPLKTLEDAIRLRGEVLRRFEEADIDSTLIDRGWLTVVIAGGGPTGVEMAGALAELFATVMVKDYPRLAVARSRVVLIEMAPDVLPPFSPASQAHADKRLRRAGVKVLTGRRVERVDASQVVLDGGEVITTRTLVWAAGVKATALPAAMGLPCDRSGRVIVERDLSVPGHPEVWAIGDGAAVTDKESWLARPQSARKRDSRSSPAAGR